MSPNREAPQWRTETAPTSSQTSLGAPLCSARHTGEKFIAILQPHEAGGHPRRARCCHRDPNTDRMRVYKMSKWTADTQTSASRERPLPHRRWPWGFRVPFRPEGTSDARGFPHLQQKDMASRLPLL